MEENVVLENVEETEQLEEVEVVDKKKRLKDLIIFIATIALVTGLTFAFKLIKVFNIIWLKCLTQCLVYAGLGVVGFFSIKLSGKKIKFNFKNYYQYIYGFIIAVILIFIFGFIPTLFGVNLMGKSNFVLWQLFYYLFFYFLLVGPVEELIYREYIQEYLVSLFKKNKWIAILIASFMFGLWHLINRSLLQVLFTFLIGCAFGFAKHYLKRLDYAGIALSHGLYDFMVYLFSIFVH